jgi:hypothetical protein
MEPATFSSRLIMKERHKEHWSPRKSEMSYVKCSFVVIILILELLKVNAGIQFLFQPLNKVGNIIEMEKKMKCCICL